MSWKEDVKEWEKFREFAGFSVAAWLVFGVAAYSRWVSGYDDATATAVQLTAVAIAALSSFTDKVLAHQCVTLEILEEIKERLETVERAIQDTDPR